MVEVPGLREPEAPRDMPARMVSTTLLVAYTLGTLVAFVLALVSHQAVLQAALGALRSPLSAVPALAVTIVVVMGAYRRRREQRRQYDAYDHAMQALRHVLLDERNQVVVREWAAYAIARMGEEDAGAVLNEALAQLPIKDSDTDRMTYQKALVKAWMITFGPPPDVVRDLDLRSVDADTAHVRRSARRRRR